MTKLTAELDRSEVAASGSSVTGSVRIEPGMTDADARRHVALCLDTSGSMSGEKIERVREGVRWVFGYLAEDDHLSIVGFDDDVEVLLPATQWGTIALDDADAVVQDLRAGGGTDILAGLEAAHGTLSDLPTGPDVGRRILLLSDGRDETPTAAFGEFARRVRREDGIAIPAAGIGDFYDEETIRTVAIASDAEWVHLSRAADIENFFGRKVETLRTVVAPSPNLELALPPGAEVGEVYLRRPQVRVANFERVGDAVRVFLPDLLEFETQEVVFTVETPPCEAGGRVTLVDVTLNTPGEAANTAVAVDCVADPAGETRVESTEVAVRGVDTMVREAAGEGDLDRAATILREATGEDVSEEATRVAGDPDADDGQGRAAEGPGDDAAGADTLGGEATQIRDVPDVSDADEGTLAELRTVVERASAADLETQYESTKIEREE
ncbi:MAG: VWA domain-containing protein [Haloarculaceae archaeon]